MWLLIDDERNLNTDAIARTPEAGKKLLSIGGWSCLCLDHDLAATFRLLTMGCEGIIIR